MQDKKKGSTDSQIQLIILNAADAAAITPESSAWDAAMNSLWTRNAICCGLHLFNGIMCYTMF
jgi:hypothetical protein